MKNRFAVLWRLARSDFRVLWFALRHPDRPRWLWPAVGALLAYAVSPIDLIPDAIPVFGLVDDVVLITLAVHWLIRRLPPHVRQAACRRASTRGAQDVRFTE